MTTDVSYNTGNWHVCLKLKYTSTASYRPKTNISTAVNWDWNSHNSLSTFRRHPRMHDKAKFSITVIWCQKKNVRNGEWDSYAQAQGQKPTLLSINRLTSSKKINRTLSKMLTKWSHWLCICSRGMFGITVKTAKQQIDQQQWDTYCALSLQ